MPSMPCLVQTGNAMARSCQPSIMSNKVHCRGHPLRAVLLEACSAWYAYDFVLKALQATDHSTMPLKELLPMEVPAQASLPFSCS